MIVGLRTHESKNEQNDNHDPFNAFMTYSNYNSLNKLKPNDKSEFDLDNIHGI